jgi:nitroreductase
VLLFRAGLSAGALYPTELYAVCGPLPTYPPVCTTRAGRAQIRRLPSPPGRRRRGPAVARLPLCLVLTGIPWRTTWKYRERGYRHLFWDAGAIVANLLAVAAAAGLKTRVLLGFVDQEVSGLLGIGQPEEYPLTLITVEAPAVAAATGSPPLGPISPRTRPLSRSPRGYPLVTAASAPASSPAPRRSAPGATRPAGSGPSRRPGRFLLVTPAAVKGLPPGAYRWSQGDLQLLGAGAVRGRTRSLCLGQDLGGDAATTVFHCAQLEPILETLGARGDRAAQLEGGVAAERLQLAAFALGLGATGLTFLDDDVSAFFGTRAALMLTVAVGVPAYRARPGRRPTQLPRIGLAER